MNKRRITSDERAVSGLVGEVLLIGIVIVAIGLIAVSVYSYLNKDPDTPHIEVDGVANMRTNEIHIKHQGGDPIEGRNLRVLVSVNGTTLPAFDEDTSDRWGIRIKGENGVEENFDRWKLGDILVLDTYTNTLPQINLTEDDDIRVTIVSLSSNRVVVSGEVFGGIFGDASINTAPIADAGDDLTDGLCENTTWEEVWVWFNGSGSYDPDNPTGGIYRGIVSWHWDFGDENESDVLDVPYVWHNYSVDGNYTVTLTVTDVDGATDTDTCTVTIRPPENLTADAGPDQWVGIGAEVRLDGSGSTGCIKEWQWEFGDGTNETVNASTTTHTYTTVGNYTVNLTVVEDHTGKTANDTAIIHVVENGFMIVYPADGDWVSGTVPIEAHVIGMEGYDHTDFSIRSVSNEDIYSQNATDDSGEVVALDTTSYTYNWSTAGLGCGNCTIKATAHNTAGTTMTDQITVCVCDALNLMGFWRLDDGTGSTTANDSSCNRNHGIIYGDPAGIIGDPWHALRFNGSDYIEVANSTSLAMTNKTTIGAWANSSDAGEQYILEKGDMVFESVGDAVVRQDETGWPQGFGNFRMRAQTFMLDHDAVLDNVSIYIRKAPGVTGGIEVSIHEDGGAGPGTKVASALIPDGDVSTSYAWITVSFNCDLTGSNEYWLVLKSPTATGGTGSYWWNAEWIWPNSPYLSGEALYSDGGGWNHLGGYDMTFELNITSVPSTYTDRISMPDPDNFKFIVYYGWLNCTYLNWSESGLELVMVADSNEAEIRAVQEAGVKVYYYIALGHSYNDSEDKDEWYANITAEMNAHNYTDGFVWDELDPEFFDPDYGCPNGTGNKTEFDNYLEQLNAHAHDNLTHNNQSKKTVANGVRYYANHCGSDYYMWESFMSTYHGNVSSPDYYYGDFFNTTGVEDDANVWINGIKKYEYLRDNGVLNKTLVHSFGEPEDDDKSIYDYIASRVLGVKGFSYANSSNFASGSVTIAEGLKWDLGTRMSYDIDADAGTLSGRFTNGYVTDYVNWSSTHNSTNYTTDLISDPLTAHWLNSSSRVTGLDFCLIRGQVDFMHGVLRSSTDITGQDSWHHNATAAAILDALNGTATLYVNGTLAAKRTFPNGLPFDFTGSNLTIGANNTGAYGFNGSIEEVRIYDS
jgi:PKD repeat protein/FlaG/FlaF family flagellin (archaellin)